MVRKVLKAEEQLIRILGGGGALRKAGDPITLSFDLLG